MKAPTGRTPTLSNEVLRLLTEIGGMSAAELVPLTGRTRMSIKDSVSRLRVRGLIYIQHYERQESGRQGQLVPVYAAGKWRPDAVRPERVDHNEVCRKSYERNKATITAKRPPSAKKVAVGMWAGLL
jgi:hypothetical protein